MHYFEKNFLYPLFWSRYEDIKQKNAKPIDISQVVGHDANEKAVLFHTENNHSILFVDNKRSYTYRKFLNSEPTTNASTVFLVSDQKGKIVLEKPHIVSETIRRNAFFDHPSTTTIPIKKPERPFEIGRLPTLNKKQQKTNSEQQQKERKTSSYPPPVSTRVSMNQRQKNQKITSTSNTKYKITKPIIKKNSSNHSLNSGICRI